DTVEPAPGTRGRRGRTLAAVALTLRDLQRPTAFGAERGGGLRAGSFATRGVVTVLRGFSFVPGVRVSGRLRLTARGDLVGRLRVTGAAAAHGRLTAGRRGRLSARSWDVAR
ncbi:MAG TPA: hypothetical protein VGW10_04075, partial [Solirubrobacteraceae bacterium]|nr:hypothetical protein [Solirubrobacteraceae bacterium]